MKRYKLIKELPMYNIGETFHTDVYGNLRADTFRQCVNVVLYDKDTLEKYPNILDEWFEEVEVRGE